MEAVGVQKLYEPSPTPMIYASVVLAANVHGRVPLMPLFLIGNSTPTIPHQLRVCQHGRGKFPNGLAHAADASGKKGSYVYEVNQWLWQFGRDKLEPCRGGLSVAATEERGFAVVKKAAKKAVATRVRRSSKARKAAASHCGRN